ncbi:aminotransferase class III-fold pyridoxal phosphate-dependent enzyme [Streptomyces somaliensis]|uniref:aspartate aminotransferase family protein n=2 Tax=Streptomyces somaliensis TaxID=78355 RepID=UPI0020CD8C1B|nr:aminotransferase class III-fold pyridoxal phosphate-dependent enzyme [Streptomyces somaliensis]MCP9944757.1 aminotransferase class III-fold pyridoxal phosphate-dependent enzyme [Streptomyces somaliensis]MCP9962016.1 aminotransferase class III-fold pyridoxal phosphate-dependent enzyme [Streptomyces somaliensis]
MTIAPGTSPTPVPSRSAPPGARRAPGREEVGRLYRDHLNRGRATLGEMFGGHVEVESRGAWVTTAEGRRFLNCGGYGVFLTGARHPTVIRHVVEQLERHPIATRLFLEPQAALAAEALISVVPDGLSRVHFAGSGAEAAETALKLARTKGRRRLVATVNGYHGKTAGALSLTGNEVFRTPFQPLLPGTAHVPFGDAAALEAMLAEAPGECCVFVEPVQGEAGVVIPPAGYLRSVREACDRNGALLVLDEVQTGLGRLGTWWGADAEGVTPDIMLVGKGLSGGVVPVSAVVATREAFSVFDRDPYLHTSTFSGAPLAMAAARGAIAAMKEEDLVTRARDLGDELLPELRRIAVHHYGDAVREVRGRGLLLGIEFAGPGPAGDLLIELIDNGVIANHSLNSHLVLRLTPPAVLDRSDVDFLYEAFDRACRAQAARYSPTAGSSRDHA